MFTKKITVILLLLSMLTLLFAGCVSVKVEKNTGVQEDQELTGELKNEQGSEQEISQLRAELGVSAIVEASEPDAAGFDDFDDRLAIREEYPVDDTFAETVRDFTRKTAAAMEEDEDNLIYSPLSLYYALSILASGSTGQAEIELTALLGYKKEDSHQRLNHFTAIFLRIMRSEKHRYPIRSGSIAIRALPLKTIGLTRPRRASLLRCTASISPTPPPAILWVSGYPIPPEKCWNTNLIPIRLK